MKRSKTILIAAIAFLGVFLTSGRAFPQGLFQTTFHGFVHFEMFYDSRQTESAREGNVLLFPAAENLDPDGVDLNARSSFQMSLLSSRLQAAIKGPEVLGAESSALFEVDFLGTGASMFNHIRMRHAKLQLDWDNTSLLAGQYWHPLFVTSCYPGVIHFGGGVPYNVLNRSPQLRLTHRSGALSYMIALLAQSDFASSGPQGKSSIYLRNGGLPETWGQIIYEQDNFLAGASAGVLSLMPRTQTAAGYITRERMTSLGGNLFVKLRFEGFEVKAQGTLGENLNHLVMLGGYGEAQLIDPVKDIYNYAGIRSLSSWIDLSDTSGKWRTGLFGGFSKNLGSTKDITGSYWTRGGNISYIFRIAPRLGYFAGNTSFHLELIYDVAAYGTPDARFQFRETNNIGNLRTQATIKYSF